MDDYSVTFARSARKELERLPEPLCSRIFPRIKALATIPRPEGCRKLQQGRNVWRIRIGDYRVIYSIDDTERVVDIIAVRHRSVAYR